MKTSPFAKRSSIFSKSIFRGSFYPRGLFTLRIYLTLVSDFCTGKLPTIFSDCRIRGKLFACLVDRFREKLSRESQIFFRLLICNTVSMNREMKCNNYTHFTFVLLLYFYSITFWTNIMSISLDMCLKMLKVFTCHRK